VSNATLITLVGPTAAGKTTLARALQQAGLGRIATTTTRAPRPDEVLGRDLHVVSEQRFNQLRSANALIATCNYSRASYGTQVRHLRAAAATALPQVIVVEPSGLTPLRSWAEEAGMGFRAVFVTSPVHLVWERLDGRYAQNPQDLTELEDRRRRADQETMQWRQLYAWDWVAENGSTEHEVEAILDLATRPAEPHHTLALSV